MKLRHTFSYSSTCFSIFLCVKSSSTSCLFFLTLLITGIKNIREKKIAHDAEMSTYKKICIFCCLLFSDSCKMAFVEDLRAYNTEFKLFCITKYIVTWLSIKDCIDSVDIL